MSNYYKVIDGLEYDFALLEEAENCVKGQGDGRISKNDADKLILKIIDRSKITEIEYRTIFYILEKFKFTDEGLKYFASKLQKK
mgnify:FL=1